MRTVRKRREGKRLGRPAPEQVPDVSRASMLAAAGYDSAPRLLTLAQQRLDSPTALRAIPPIGYTRPKARLAMDGIAWAATCNRTPRAWCVGASERPHGKNRMSLQQYQTDSRTSQRMSAIRPIGSAPEMKIRRLLHREGYRYRVNRYDLPGRPDIVFLSRHKIIFVHGCFWHRHPRCRRATMPSRNREAWHRKFKATVERDRMNIQRLRHDGWDVMVVWECSLPRLDEVTQQIEKFLNA